VAQNSAIPVDTCFLQLSAAKTLVDWLRVHGGTQKEPQALLVLADATLGSLEKGGEAPCYEVEALLALYLDTFAGLRPEVSAGSWLRRKKLTEWWQAHRDDIAIACREAGLDLAPDLLSPQGGGRGNSSRYQFRFRGLDAFALSEPIDGKSETLADTESDASTCVRYQVDPATPTWWARGWWIKHEGFPTRSWRGVLLLAQLLLGGAAALLMWSTIGLLFWMSPFDDPKNFLLLVVTIVLTWMLWVELRPLARLSANRISIAPSYLLDINQFYAQLTLRKSAGGKVPIGWFTLSRHWGICPICLGEVDLADGAPAFPGRMVGRCADSPLEHVFSFDPALLSGIHLYASHANSHRRPNR